MPSVEFSGSNASVRVSYTETYNAAANTSTIKLTDVEMKGSAWYGTVAIHGRVAINGTVLCSIGPGVSASQQINLDTSYGSISNLSLGSIVVAHNANGAGSFTMTLMEADNASATYNQGWFGTYYQYKTHVGVGTPTSKAVSLTTHPRISSVTATNAYFGDPVTITLNRYNSGFTHTVKVTCAGNTETLMTQGSTYPTLTWTPALATYAPLIRNSMSATATVSCSTYNGSTLIGTSTTTCTLTFKAADVAPSVSIATSDPTGCLTTYGKFVKSKSKITVTLTNTFAFGATLSTTQITANGATYNESPATTDFVLSADNTSITARIVDSRGQVATASITIEIYDYTAPQINSYAVHRCKDDGTEDNTGAYFSVVYSITVTPLGNVNSKTLTAKYKKQSAQSYASQNIPLSSYTETSVSAPIAADTNSTYNVRIELSDDFGTSFAELKLPTAATRMNWGAGVDGGVAIGKVSEYDKTFEIADGWRVKGQGFFDAVYPVGSIYMSVNSTSPATRFGGTWEQLEDRFLLGAGTTYTAGDTGGEAEHTLTIDEMPSHNHPYAYNGQLSNTGTQSVRLVAYDRQNAYTGTPDGYRGGDQPHNNMPPYIVVYMWKRTA